MIKNDKNTKLCLFTGLVCSFLLLASCRNNMEPKMINSRELVKEETKESLIGEAVSYEKQYITLTDYDYFDSSETNIPEYKEIKYYNPQTGDDEIVVGKLVEVSNDDNSPWIEEVDAEYYISQSEEYGQVKELNIDLNSVKPEWTGKEKEILLIGGLNNQGYRIADSYWKDSLKIIDDTKNRTAVYVFKKDIHGVKARYEGEVELVEKDEISSDNMYYAYIKRDRDLLDDYRSLNKDTYGIIRIEGEKLNHPLMYCEDNEGYYLWHDLEKKYNSHGIPFLTKDSDIEKNRGNSIIYGHRLNDGDVFGGLSLYEDIEYYKEHPIIETVSNKGNSKWLIIAYYLVCNEDINQFRYFDNDYFLSKEGFQEYMNEVCKRNWLNVPYEVSIEDSFITLSSCSKEKSGDGTNRMVVMAVKIEYDYNYDEVVNIASMADNPLLPEKLR